MSILRPPGDSIPVQLRRRRDAALRLEPLVCGCRDPWPCRCHDYEQSDVQFDAYQDAAQHLMELDLSPGPDVVAMRRMWRRGGHSQRLAMEIADRWEVTA
jgi:hypothetical protein